MRARVIMSLIGATLVGVVTIASPAEAKGIPPGTVDGAGLDRPLELGAGWNDVDELWSDFGLYGTITTYGSMTQGSRLLGGRPTSALGPRLAVTWQIPGSEGAETVQHLYPYAEGGPLLYTPPGQVRFPAVGVGRTSASWFRAEPHVLSRLRALGLPGRDALAPPQPPARATPREDGTGSFPTIVLEVSIAAAALVTGGLIIASRRRRAAPATT